MFRGLRWRLTALYLFAALALIVAAVMLFALARLLELQYRQVQLLERMPRNRR